MLASVSEFCSLIHHPILNLIQQALIVLILFDCNTREKDLCSTPLHLLIESVFRSLCLPIVLTSGNVD